MNLFILLILSLCGCILARPQNIEVKASVAFRNGHYEYLEGIFTEDALATATYTQSNAANGGWGFLSIKIHKENHQDDQVLAYAAGYIEGYMTSTKITAHYSNMKTFTWFSHGSQMPSKIGEFFAQQRIWMANQVKNNPKDNYWKQVGTVLSQNLGLVDGYNHKTGNRVTYEDLQVITSFGDIFDVEAKFDRPVFEDMSADQIKDFVMRNGHCSSLFRVSENNADIFFGHTSWFTYSAGVNRIFKEYDFDFHNPAVTASKIAFSSYPGTLSSNDDFLVNNNQMMVIETSNNIFNTTLYDQVSPASLLCWQRVNLATRMANSSEHWTEIFSQHNSGTYNNQYFVFSWKGWKPGSPIADGSFWIAEQIPGFVDRRDMTSFVKANQHWPSYNVPYSKYIYETSGYPSVVKKDPHMLDYDHCCRANIFRRNQTTINTIDHYKAMLRYNDYQNDPLSLGNPGYSIASRADLTPGGKFCGGGYDTKAVSLTEFMKTGLIHIINGPSTDQTPDFDWSQPQCQSPQYEHHGLVGSYKYPWAVFKSSLNE